jgi:hypothetical protein
MFCKKYNMKLGTLLFVVAWAVIGISSCGGDSRSVKSEEELKSVLSEAFQEGDIDTVSALFHSSTDSELKGEMVAFLKPWVESKPTAVTPSIIRLEDIPLDLPGNLNGRALRYTTSIDGVVFLDGRSQGELGEEKLELYMPFTRSEDGYSLAGVAYDHQHNKKQNKLEMATPRNPSD